MACDPVLSQRQTRRRKLERAGRRDDWYERACTVRWVRGKQLSLSRECIGPLLGSLQWVKGSSYYAEFATSQGKLGMMADITIEGKIMRLENLMIYPAEWWDSQRRHEGDVSSAPALNY